MTMKIVSVRIAQPKELNHMGMTFSSGVDKKRVFEPVYCAKNGLVGDYHGDKQNHGTPDKALLVYPFVHYARWKAELKRNLDFGAFGENLIIQGLNERIFCIGDRIQSGDVILEISQPRFPCWKIAQHSGIPDLVERIHKYPRTGFYVRVIQEGWLDPMGSFHLLERPYPMHTIALAYRVRLDPRPNLLARTELLENVRLAQEWRDSLFQEEILCQNHQ